MFSLLHVVCAGWCYIAGRCISDPRIRGAAFASALFYMASPVIDHVFFDHPHSLKYTYFTVFAMYDAAWGWVLIKYYDRQWAAVVMAAFVMMEIVSMFTIGKTPKLFSTLLNIIFLGCLILPDRKAHDQ